MVKQQPWLYNFSVGDTVSWELQETLWGSPPENLLQGYGKLKRMQVSHLKNVSPYSQSDNGMIYGACLVKIISD